MFMPLGKPEHLFTNRTSPEAKLLLNHRNLFFAAGALSEVSP
jgi:hypothetical protein